jgi:hypothetical protein
MLLTPEDRQWKPERTANQPSGHGTPAVPGTLGEAIAKAHRWQEQIEAGEYAGIEDLAQALSVDRTYVGRMLRLASLAPDIIEAVLRGDEPEGVSLRKLRKEMRLRWEEQRARVRSHGK